MEEMPLEPEAMLRLSKAMSDIAHSEVYAGTRHGRHLIREARVLWRESYGRKHLENKKAPF